MHSAFNVSDIAVWYVYFRNWRLAKFCEKAVIWWAVGCKCTERLQNAHLLYRNI